nr:PREDICTED: 5'-AMP-activated protein kinase subunit gamma-2-like [Paralichthys olivaceus]
MYLLSSAREKQQLRCSCSIFLSLSTASGLSTPPTTPTQVASQPVFTQEAQASGPSPERLEPRSRSRSHSTPADTGQRLFLPSAKPPIPSSSPVPAYSTSQQVSGLFEGMLEKLELDDEGECDHLLLFVVTASTDTGFRRRLVLHWCSKNGNNNTIYD